MRDPIKQKVDLCFVLKQTAWNQAYLDHHTKVVEDKQKKGRQEKQECRICFYGMKAGGSVSTSALCGLCDKEMRFGSTCVDVLCKECAKEHRLCHHCGGDVEMKDRRKL